MIVLFVPKSFVVIRFCRIILLCAILYLFTVNLDALICYPPFSSLDPDPWKLTRRAMLYFEESMRFNFILPMDLTRLSICNKSETDYEE